MNCKRIIVFLFTYLLISNILNSQVTYEMPKVIPPSPAAANFLRYGEIPVDYCTGVPSISVPLYTVKSRKLELPISISYHASGIKVNDKASVIGLGWVLNAGGLVASTIMGLQDNENGPVYGPLTYTTADAFNAARNSVSQAQDPSMLEPIAWQTFGSLIDYEEHFKDWSSDRYSFQLPDGESGVFRYDLHTGQLIKLPYTPVKIEKVSGAYMGSPGKIVEFRITDAKGVIYSFKLPADGQLGTSISNWDLVSIISADKTDTIRLVYKSGENKYYTPSFASFLQLGDVPVSISLSSGTWAAQAQFSNSATPTGLYTSERILDSIISSSAIIKVTAASDRQDMGVGFGKYRVNKLSVYDRFSGTLIKEFNFNQSYFGSAESSNQRLRLDSVSISGSDASVVETYRFAYNNDVALPRPPEVGTYEIFSEDYWGYYNGSAEYSLIPSQFVPATVVNTHSGPDFNVPSQYIGNRSPNHTYAAAALIKEIGFPTGGKTVFEFEPNYADNAFAYPNIGYQAGNVGGFRVHKISNYTSAGALADFKTYTYSPGTTRTVGADLFSYDQRNFVRFPSDCAWQVDYTLHNITSNPALPLTCENGPPVLYDEVTEYNGDETGAIGKTVYNYAVPPTTQYASYDETRFQDPFEYDRGNYIPTLLSKTEYKNENNQYVPVHKSENIYSTFLSDPYFTGIHLVETSSYPTSDQGFDYIFGSPAICHLPSVALGHPLYFNLYDLHATQEVNLLTQSKDYYYSPDGTQSLVSSTSLTYGSLANYTNGSPAHLQPTEQTSVNSKNETVKTDFTYPVDFAMLEPYPTMVNRNILTPVIEEKHYNGTQFMRSAKANYIFQEATNNIIEPQTVQTQVLTDSPEVRLRYNRYDDKGNVLSVQKEKDIQNSYIWDYNQTYPIAQVKNSSNNDIAYTSFEADGSGNWTIGSPLRTSDALTGSQCYDISNGAMSKTGLNTLKTYIVSYWAKPGAAITVAGATSTVQLSQKNGWIYWEAMVHGVTGTTISGTGLVDEVRLYPKDAQMTTYTYAPLIGITSQCDAGDKIIYYKYDPFNRLKLIRDQDGNILKTFTYKYNEQQ